MSEEQGNTSGGRGGVGDGGREGAVGGALEGDVLLTGFPDFVAERIGRRALAAWPGARLLVLQRDHEDALEAFRQSLPVQDRSRVVGLAGHVCHMDLGLTSKAYAQLRERVRLILHVASSYHADGPGYGLRRVNLQGSREVVELAGQCAALERLVHVSTVRVSGCRRGVVLEEELEAGQRFHSPYEQTRYEAERLIRRAGRTLPVTVVRPGIVVGDSTSGELRPYEGPWDLLERFLFAPRGQPVLLPGSGDAPVHLVPVDFVAQAAVFLATAPDALGQTFHLVDPSPLSARKVFELVARKARRRPAQRGVPRLLSQVLRAHPRVARLNPFQVAPPEVFDQMVFYNAQRAMQVLDAGGIRCPPLTGYLDRLVRYAQQTHARRGPGGPEDLPEDPLA